MCKNESQQEPQAQTIPDEGAKLVIIDGHSDARQVHLGDTAVIGGSSKKEADILVDSKLFSAVHGRFYKEEEEYWYQHIDTQNNTYYNGVLFGSSGLDRKNPVKLRDGDTLHVGGRTETGRKETQVVMIFRRKYDRKAEWKSVDLKDYAPKFHITRHEEADKGSEIIPDSEVSPEHCATLSLREDGWVVEDHRTVSGIYVNNVKIDKEKKIEDFDLIRVGGTTFLYEYGHLYYNHREYSDNRLVIRIEERSVWNLFKKHVLLKNINLNIEPGEMVLILGGSGAGKTTFINAVMGYEKAKGTIMQGNRNLYQEYDEMKYEIGFVPQEDLLRTEDTVEYTLENAAELKLPVSTTDEERADRIKEVLETFGLERERKSLVEKLSGGQRKRLSIAVEYISDPHLFFLDEPDSGLDAVMSRNLMEHLRRIADEDRIVMVITHSPNRVADLFDKVIVLAKSEGDNTGRLAYFGSPEDASSFFGCEKLEDIIGLVNRKDEGGEGRADEFIKKYEALEG